MRAILNNLFDTSSYHSRLQRERAIMLYVLSVIALIMVTLFALLNRNAANQTLWEQAGTNPGGLITTLLGYVASFAVYMLVRRQQLIAASLIMLLITAASIGIPAVTEGMYSATYGLGVALVLVMGVVLMRARGGVIGLVLALVICTLGIANRAQVPPPTQLNNISSMVNAILLLFSIALVNGLLLRYASVSRVEGVQSVAAERLRLAELTSQISQRISHRMPLQAVLTNAVEQIRTEFPNIYHAQIFLVEESRQNARLVASTGEVGRLLIERQHSLPVGSLSVIGQVTARQQPVIARAASSDGVHRRNEFLPDTAVEAAFPLRIGDTIIGALDLQSKESTTFDTDDLPIFQSLSDHLAIAIDNARLFEASEQRLRDNQQLVEQTQRAAEEVHRLNQQLTRQSWDDYLAQQPGAAALTVDFAAQHTLPDTAWTETLTAAVQANQPVQRQQDGARVIAVPLRVRGQVVGAMEFELDETGRFAPEDLNLLQEVGERLGLAAENIRLFEASQSAAQRETLVNDIAARLQASSSVEMALNAAARSLKETMKASRVAIRLGKPAASVIEDKQP